MATTPTKFDHHVQVGGKMRKLVGMWVRVGGKWHPVTNGWSRVAGAWRPWVHTTGGGGQPPVHPPTTVHLATVHAIRAHGHISWTIPAGRHVVSQRLTIKAGHGVHCVGKLNGHTFSLNPGQTFSITVPTATRSVPYTMSGGTISTQSVRYRYT